MFRVDDGIRSIRGDDPAAPAALADLPMGLETIDRRLCRRQHLDVESLEQRPRAKRLGSQCCADRVEVRVGARRVERYFHPEYHFEHVIEPQRRRCSAEQIEVLREQLPCRARVRVGRSLA